MRKIERREFAREAALAFLAGVTVSVSACGGGGAGGGGGDGYGPTASTPTGTAASGDKTGQVSSNHGHTAVIRSAQLQAGGALQLDIAGSAGHSHMVNLPAAAIQDIKDGKKVQLQSTSTEAHAHAVTFNPEQAGNPSEY